jgi:hypothetical protein
MLVLAYTNFYKLLHKFYTYKFFLFDCYKLYVNFDICYFCNKNCYFAESIYFYFCLSYNYKTFKCT